MPAEMERMRKGNSQRLVCNNIRVIIWRVSGKPGVRQPVFQLGFKADPYRQKSEAL